MLLPHAARSPGLPPPVCFYRMAEAPVLQPPKGDGAPSKFEDNVHHGSRGPVNALRLHVWRAACAEARERGFAKPMWIVYLWTNYIWCCWDPSWDRGGVLMIWDEPNKDQRSFTVVKLRWVLI